MLHAAKLAVTSSAAWPAEQNWGLPEACTALRSQLALQVILGNRAQHAGNRARICTAWLVDSGCRYSGLSPTTPYYRACWRLAGGRLRRPGP